MAKQAKRGSYLDVSGDSLQGFQTITTSTTLTVASPKQGYVSSPAAAVTVTLPTTDVKAGFIYKIDVTGATETNFVVLNSSGGNEIDRIGGDGFIQVIALQDAPTTAAHWRVTSVREKNTVTATFNTGAGTGGTYPAAINILFNRQDRSVSVSIPTTSSASTGTSATSTIGTSAGIVPSRFRAPTSVYPLIQVNEGGTRQAGLFGILSNGGIAVYKITETPWASSSSYNLIQSQTSCSYTV
jgi:hypothetical protein